MAEILIVSLGSTSGLRAADAELAAARRPDVDPSETMRISAMGALSAFR